MSFLGAIGPGDFQGCDFQGCDFRSLGLSLSEAKEEAEVVARGVATRGGNDAHELSAIAEGEGRPGANGIDPIVHSNRFVLVDREGRIRATYDPFERGALERLEADAQRLLAERPDGA